MIEILPTVISETPTDDQVYETTRRLLRMEQAHCPVTHRFAPGIYTREVFMPAGTFAIGFKHRTEHLNVMSKGRMLLLIDGQRLEVSAPYVMKSRAGLQKFAHVLEDTLWMTIHPTAGMEHCGEDVDKLEAVLLFPSQALDDHKQELKLLEFPATPSKEEK